MYCFADYHTHTKYSHGTGTVAQNVVAAATCGLEEIAISDHGPNHLFGYGIRDVEVLRTIKTELAKACEQFPQLRGLVGIEANIISMRGDLDLPGEQVDLVDIVLANIHSLVRPHSWRDTRFIWGFHYGKRLIPSLEERSKLINTKATVNAIMRNKIHILTHPGFRFAIDYKVVAQACAERGTAFELNTSKSYLTPDIVQVVAKEGANFIISSDAHSPDRVGDLAAGIELAKKAGLSTDQILNAREKRL